MCEMHAMLNLRSLPHLLEHDFLVLSSKTLEPREMLGEVPKKSNESDKDLKAGTFERRLKEQELFLL